MMNRMSTSLRRPDLVVIQTQERPPHRTPTDACVLSKALRLRQKHEEAGRVEPVAVVVDAGVDADEVAVAVALKCNHRL